VISATKKVEVVKSTIQFFLLITFHSLFPSGISKHIFSSASDSVAWLIWCLLTTLRLSVASAMLHTKILLLYPCSILFSGRYFSSSSRVLQNQTSWSISAALVCYSYTWKLLKLMNKMQQMMHTVNFEQKNAMIVEWWLQRRRRELKPSSLCWKVSVPHAANITWKMSGMMGFEDYLSYYNERIMLIFF
jgi:hypothetical protein